jgi:hypothetical protein
LLLQSQAATIGDKEGRYMASGTSNTNPVEEQFTNINVFLLFALASLVCFLMLVWIVAITALVFPFLSWLSITHILFLLAITTAVGCLFLWFCHQLKVIALPKGTAQQIWVTLIATVLGATVTATVDAFARQAKIQNASTVVLEGTAEAGINGQPVVVYYKTPFASPPSLTFPEGEFGYEVSEQSAKSFKVKRLVGESADVKDKLRWKAEGPPAQ